MDVATAKGVYFMKISMSSTTKVSCFDDCHWYTDTSAGTKCICGEEILKEKVQLTKISVSEKTKKKRKKK